MMVKLDIYSGLLGNGKTTLIKRMLKTAYAGFRVAIIENEIGEINLDAEEFEENSVSVKEVTAGCLCCTVKGSFQEAVRFLAERENPDYIIVEPTGAADIRGVIEACEQVDGVELNRCIMVVNARKIQTLLKVAGEFFHDQIRVARTIYLNFAEKIDAGQVQNIKKNLRKVNPILKIVDTPMEEVTGDVFAEKECLDGHWGTAGRKRQAAPPDYGQHLQHERGGCREVRPRLQSGGWRKYRGLPAGSRRHDGPGRFLTLFQQIDLSPSTKKPENLISDKSPSRESGKSAYFSPGRPLGDSFVSPHPAPQAISVFTPDSPPTILTRNRFSFIIKIIMHRVRSLTAPTCGEEQYVSLSSAFLLYGPSA